LESLNFYRDLTTLQLPPAEILHQINFTDVPRDWFVIVADVQNSTAAVNAGRHNDVNLVAAGSLIAALNIAREKNVEVPFFFSGDGGSLLLPEELVDDVISGLWLHNENSTRNFGLSMHIGSLAVQTIYDTGATLRIAKMQLGYGLHKAAILGNGLKVAEQQIKKASNSSRLESANMMTLNMEGLECRWDKIKPPEQENEIVCYLIDAVDQTQQAAIYREVLMKIDDIYGTVETRSPLSINRLKLLLNLQKLEKEMLAKYGQWKFGYYVKSFLENLLGIFFFRFDLNLGTVTGKEYLHQLIANADTLTLDGRINTIISGKESQRKKFLQFLASQEKQGKLVYGHHISRESVMTCYIENRNASHIHFVDGSDGGYTEAAKELKKKLSLVTSS
jgi:hypothetical protein